MRETTRCPHCGELFGYWIDGKFYPVAWHKHKVGGVKIQFFPDGREVLEKRDAIAARPKIEGE